MSFTQRVFENRDFYLQRDGTTPIRLALDYFGQKVSNPFGPVAYVPTNPLLRLPHGRASIAFGRYLGRLASCFFSF